MNFYTYSAPGTGVNADELRNEETWKGYFDAGLNVMTLYGGNAYSGEVWETSNTKKCFDIAKKNGITKILLDDMRIYELVELKDKLVGSDPDCKFKSEDELDAFVETCMKDYIYDPCFFGLRLRDEPVYGYLKAYAECYRSIKRVGKKLGKDYVYINMNLLPFDAVVCHGAPTLSHLTASELYTKYIEDYLKETGADWLSVDNYPYHLSDNGGRFYEGYYSTFQALRRACDKYGVKLAFVVASFEMENRDGHGLAGFRRVSSVNDMFLQVNSALGFGARELVFYTYVTMASSPESRYLSRDGSSFITSQGVKTWIYNYGKSAIEHAKRLEKVLFDYDFKGAKLLFHDSIDEIEVPKIKDLPESLLSVKAAYLSGWPISDGKGGFTTLEFDNTYEFKNLKDISFDKDILLVSHFNGKDGDMYMFENVIDRAYKFSPSSMKLTVDFGSDIKAVKVLKEKDFERIVLNGGVLTTELSIGEAVWVIPEK